MNREPVRASKMRLLFVSTSTTTGGAEKILSSLAEGLDPARFEVAAVASLKPLGRYGRALALAGIETVSLGASRVAGPRQVLALSRLIARTKPDAVLALMYQAIQVARAVRLLTRLRFRLVTSPHINYRSRGRFSLWIDGRLKGADDLSITECESSRRRLVESLGYAPARVRAIHNGVDLSALAPDASARARVRRELGIGEGEILVGTAGRLDRQKDQGALIKALKLLEARRPAISGIVLGEGPLRGELSSLISANSLSARVRLLGEVRDPRPYYAALDIFVLPSLWEGFPMVLLEAMAMGLPVVASRVDGVPEAISHGINGILVEPGRPEELAAAVQSLASLPEVREKLGRAARETVAKRFGLKAMLSSYEDAFLSLRR